MGHPPSPIAMHQPRDSGPERARPPQRAVRSYVRRQGRMTRGQRRALAAWWPRYGVEGEGALDLEQLFGRRAPCRLEVGFGMGEALAEMAQAHPERDYLGIDVYEPGVGRLLGQLAGRALDNVRVICGDALDVLAQRVPDESFEAVLVFFPDPWPKKRHHKRRLVQPRFAGLVAAKLELGGRLHLATDCEDYAEQMLVVLEAESALANLAGRGRFSRHRGERPASRFESRGQRLGHRVRDLIFEKQKKGTL
jgi:tRNA (guanine-N7-)-methyltransferase